MNPSLINTQQYLLFDKGMNCKNIFSIVKIKNKRKWTKEEDQLLIELADKFKEKHWKDISLYFHNKNPLQCFSRYKRIRPGIVKGSWSKEEDQRILQLVNVYGKSWSKISRILNTRNGKQIRDRFINVLDPYIKKGKFTEEEDRHLIKLYIYHGPKWATISKHFRHRTADMIKNRFHSSIKKLIYGGDKTLNKDIFKNINEEINCENCLNCKDSSDITANSNLTPTNKKFNFELNEEKLIQMENKELNMNILDLNGPCTEDAFENNNLFNFEDYFTV